jgi:DNA-binding CsgD family transcriptional regulator
MSETAAATPESGRFYLDEAALPQSYVLTKYGTDDFSTDPIIAFGAMGGEVAVDYGILSTVIQSNTLVLAALVLKVQEIANLRHVSLATAKKTLLEARNISGAQSGTQALDWAFKSKYFERVHAVDDPISMSDRQFGVAEAVMDGHSVKQICRKYTISSPTTKKHLVRLREKGLRKQSGVALYMHLSGAAEYRAAEAAAIQQGLDRGERPPAKPKMVARNEAWEPEGLYATQIDSAPLPDTIVYTEEPDSARGKGPIKAFSVLGMGVYVHRERQPGLFGAVSDTFVLRSLGLSGPQVADERGVALPTVRGQLGSARKAIGGRNAQERLSLAFDSGIFEKAGSQSSAVMLTPRERDVLTRTIRGDTVDQIADSLGIRPTTVKTYRQHLRQMGLKNRMVITLFANLTDLRTELEA